MSFALVETFDSLNDMIDFASGPTDMTRSRASRDTDDPEWYKSDTFDDAINVAREGFVDAQERAEALASDITSKVRKVMGDTQALQHDMTGNILDLDAYLSGEADCLMLPVVTQDEQTAPTCRILVNCAFSGMTDSDFYVQQGAVVIALCDALRAAGYTTEVWACSTNQGSRGRKLTHAARVKSFDDFGSVSSMLFGLAHPSFHRRLAFSCRERMDADLRSEFGVGMGGYGRSVEPEIPGEEFDITIGSGSSVTRDPVQYILSTLTGLGVEITD